MKWLGNVSKKTTRFTYYTQYNKSYVHFQIHVKGQGLDQMQRDTTTRKLPLFRGIGAANHSVVSTNSHHALLHGRLRQQTVDHSMHGYL